MWSIILAIAILGFVVVSLVLDDDSKVPRWQRVARALGFVFVGLFIFRDALIPGASRISHYVILVIGLGFALVAWSLWFRCRRNERGMDAANN